METLNIDLPAMYADHHVAVVRGLLAALPGVAEVYASAAQCKLRVTFDPAQISADDITAALAEHGYLPGDVLTALAGFFDSLRHMAAMEPA
jgi:copper chaperone CopZ